MSAANRNLRLPWLSTTDAIFDADRGAFMMRRDARHHGDALTL